MKTQAMKITALVLCAVLIFGVAGTAVHALAAGGAGQEVEAKTAEAAAPADGGEALDGTVYVLTGADGAVRKTIYGNDAPGQETGELPVELAVTYRLDGKPVAPEELAGKSGHVTIRFDYRSKQSGAMKIGGKQETLYVPFAVLTGVLLENDRFANVEVSNGKLVNDGDRTAVIGIAFPGLQENLNVDPEKLEIPSYVEITADTTDFELGMTLTLATNELFNEVDIDELNSAEDLRESLGTLTDAMEQLTGGSSQLYDGLGTLLEKSEELADGIGQLSAGAQSLKKGIGTLDSGAAEAQAGAGELSAGLDALAASSGALNGGAAQVFETLLSTASTQLSAAGVPVPAMTISNYAEVLNGVIASLDETSVYEQALAAVTAAVEEQRSYIMEQVTAAVQAEVTERVTSAVRAQVTAQVTDAVHENVAEQVILAATGMDKESYDAAVAAGAVEEQIQAAVESAIEEQLQSEAVLQLIETNVAAQMASEDVQAAIAANVEEQMRGADIQELIAANTQLQVEKAISENMAGDAVQAQLAAASEGAKTVIVLKASLDSYNSFYLGLQSYTAGVAQAAAGAQTLKAGIDSLKAGSSQLYSGATELCGGMSALSSGAPALVDGVAQLRDGAMRLSDGLKEFDEKGVQALVEAVDGDLEGLIERIRGTVEVSRNYRWLPASQGEAAGQVKFIYRTDPIKAD